MTAGGVSSLLICLENMKLDETERKELVAAIERGFDALGKKMKLDKDTLYALYGIERAGILGSKRKMAGKAWYAPGAERLIAQQTREGFWQGAYNEAVNTCLRHPVPEEGHGAARAGDDEVIRASRYLPFSPSVSFSLSGAYLSPSGSSSGSGAASSPSGFVSGSGGASSSSFSRARPRRAALTTRPSGSISTFVG